MPPRPAAPAKVLVLSTALLAAMLGGCGGGGGGGGGGIIVTPGTPSAPDTGRGTLVTSPATRVVSFSATELRRLLEADAGGRAILQVAGTPTCGVDVRYLEYRTVGGRGEATTATGALMLPRGDGATCNGGRPIVLYAHGTSPARNYNLARLIDPNQPAAAEGILVAAMFAAQGFIVVAPNYAGYDSSPLPYHPYLNGDQQGKDMADALAAARRTLAPLDARESGAPFVTGYSQGGYVALAALRELQTAGQALTAVAPLSAPSAISLLVDYNFSGWPALGSTVFTPLLTTSWQRQGGDVYSATGDIYEARYANGIDTLLPNPTPINQIFAAGLLPPLALYPANATPGPLSPSLAVFYGEGNLIRQSYLTQAANDIAATPCAGNALPATQASLTTSAPLNCRPLLGFRRAAVANDLRSFLPARPLLMCGGAQDPTVNFLSTQATAGYFRARGMAPENLTVLDLEQPGGVGDPFAAARAGFAQAKASTFANAAGSDADKAAAVAQAYHGTLVPPFCLAAARGYFQALLDGR